MPETAHKVIIDHPGRLHIGITDRRAHELESILFHRPGHFVRLKCRCWNLFHGPKTVLPGLMIHELPDIVRETTCSLPYVQK